MVITGCNGGILGSWRGIRWRCLDYWIELAELVSDLKGGAATGTVSVAKQC